LIDRLFLTAVLLLAAACTAKPIREPSELPPVAIEPTPAAPEREGPPTGPPAALLAPPPRIDEVYVGTGVSIDVDAARLPQRHPAGDITLSFEQTDLREAVRVILGDLMASNYVIDPDVTGTVTLITERPLSQAALRPVLEAVLASQGARLVDYGDFYRITHGGDAGALAGGGIAVAPASLTRGAGFRVFPLGFIAAADMARILEPMLPPGAIARADADRNLLIIAGMPAQLQLAASTVKMFDVDQMVGESIMLTSLERASARTVAAELESIFATGDGTAGAERLIRFVPIDRMNAIMVIAKQPAYLEEARNWIFRLDRIQPTVGAR
jgi:general secretion pathway protein D